MNATEPEERALSTIPNAIPAGVFERDTERYRGKTVVVYCTIGSRNGEYASRLRKKGINAFNLKGGVLAYVRGGNE